MACELLYTESSDREILGFSFIFKDSHNIGLTWQNAQPPLASTEQALPVVKIGGTAEELSSSLQHLWGIAPHPVSKYFNNCPPFSWSSVGIEGAHHLPGNTHSLSYAVLNEDSYGPQLN